jgi:hypothetical protein
MAAPVAAPAAPSCTAVLLLTLLKALKPPSLV